MDEEQNLESQVLSVTSVTSTLCNGNVCLRDDVQKINESSIEINSDTTMLTSEIVCGNDVKDKVESLRVNSVTPSLLSANISDSERAQNTEDGTSEVTSGISTFSDAHLHNKEGIQSMEEGAVEVSSYISTVTDANVCGSDETEKMEKEVLGFSSATLEANNSSSERTQESKTGTIGITSDTSEVSNAIVSNTAQKLDEGTSGVTSNASMLSTTNVCSNDKTQKMEGRALGTTSDTSTFSSVNPVKRRKLTGAQRRRLKVKRAIEEGKPIPPKKNRPAGLNVERAFRESKPIPPGEKNPARNDRKKDNSVLTNSLIQKKYTYPSNKVWCDPSLDEFILNTNSVSYPVGRSVAYNNDNFCTQVEPKIFGIEERSYRVMSNTFTFTGANVSDGIQRNHAEDVLTKSSAQSHNVNSLGKRLSGAQRRKLRKAYMAANQMFPREDTQPRPAPERYNDSVMWPLTQSRDYGPSSQNSASYDINTPSIQEGFDRSMISYSCGGTEASREQIENIEVAIIPVEYPNVILIENDFEVIQQQLVGEIADLARKGSERGPKFESCCFSRGLVLITCQNKETEDWLVDQVYKMDYVNGIRIKAAKPKQVLNVYKVSVWIPKPLNSLPVQNILSMLQSQNQGLRTLDWDLLDKIEEPNGQTLVLKIDSDSQKVLEAMNYKAYMGLTMVNFRDHLTSNYQH